MTSSAPPTDPDDMGGSAGKLTSSRVPPIVVVLGATATGKSALAVSLASKWRGEIISADSMQIYKGLDILTNKVTEEEMAGVPHHMISVVDPTEKFDVYAFRNRALPIVERVLSENKIPLIVGGTNYYIESLLWKILIDKSRTGKRKAQDEGPNVEDVQHDDNPILSLFSRVQGELEEEDCDQWSSSELHLALTQVDPERSVTLHPNNRRKIFRSLQVRFQTGRKHSDLIREQCLALKSDSRDPDGEVPVPVNHLGGPLRYPNSICLWIQSPSTILDERIEKRVDAMVEHGLREELDTFMSSLKNNNSKLDFTKGLNQAIGFKEFIEYLQLDPATTSPHDLETAFKKGTDDLKLATRQYARSQVKWIRNRFLKPSRRQLPPIYWLDGSSLASADWDRNVVSIGQSILEAHINNGLNNPLLKERHVKLTLEEIADFDRTPRVCEDCDRVFMGNVQYQNHLGSNRHYNTVKKKKRLERQRAAAEAKAMSPRDSTTTRCDNGSHPNDPPVPQAQVVG